MSSPSRVHRSGAAVRPRSQVSVIPSDLRKQFAVVRSYSSGLLAKVRVVVSDPVVRSKEARHFTVRLFIAFSDTRHPNAQTCLDYRANKTSKGVSRHDR